VTVTLYHNPDCGTSRSTLALLRACGVEPAVIEYLRTPPSTPELVGLLDRMGVPVREILRQKDTPYAAMGLGDPARTDAALHAAIQAHPILLNRPIVVTAAGAKLCRPSEVVLDLLPGRRPVMAAARDDGTAFLRDHRARGDDPDLVEALAAAGLPTADLTDPGRIVFRYTTLDRQDVGWGGFERYGADVLLRSMMVMPWCRRQGGGRNLAALLMRRAYDQGARQAYALTGGPEARAFFERLGFSACDRAAAPAAIRTTRQASGLCPASATLLTKRITF
jgi:arsenate reductase (glutaredoxin)